MDKEEPFGAAPIITSYEAVADASVDTIIDIPEGMQPLNQTTNNQPQTPSSLDVDIPDIF